MSVEHMAACAAEAVLMFVHAAQNCILKPDRSSIMLPSLSATRIMASTAMSLMAMDDPDSASIDAPVTYRRKPKGEDVRND
ncbi:MAG: hypothetical protein ABJZ69_17140 [Hyphomicrobiales bacterium]